jgi:C-terminal processing protease CtpA/Prc
MFPMGDRSRLLVRKASGGDQMIEVSVPDPKSKKHPVVIPKLISTQRLEAGIGYLKVSMFPGVVGIEIARDITRAVEELACDRLIIDLRGNTGGGMGCLRLMSLMVPDRRPVGYSLTRKKAESGFDRERLPRFDAIPERKLGLVPLLAKFAFGDKSIAVFTEGRGTNRVQGRTVLLVNEHSASASEMIAAFAGTEGRVQIVGTRTPGRVVGSKSFKVGEGFRVALPVAAYRTWDGTLLEGIGVAPGINVDFEPQATDGQDPQLEAARAMIAEW